MAPTTSLTKVTDGRMGYNIQHPTAWECTLLTLVYGRKGLACIVLCVYTVLYYSVLVIVICKICDTVAVAGAGVQALILGWISRVL